MIHTKTRVGLTLAIAIIGATGTTGLLVQHVLAACNGCFLETNPTTGNPHHPSAPGDPTTQTGTERGNPHITSCSGDPHGQSTHEPDTGCHGSQ